MDETSDFLRRIANALDRLAPAAMPAPDWTEAPAFVWDGHAARPIAKIETPPLALLQGIDKQKQAVSQNVARLAQGHAAHDMLLWGARGAGKSALVKASVLAAQDAGGALALVQLAPDAITALPDLFAQLSSAPRNFLVYLDDLGFSGGEDASARHLRSWLDGGIEARPRNIRIAVTSNRRAILPRDMSEQDDPINPRDVVDDKLALSERFGLSLGFHAVTQDDYLAMLRGYAEHYGLDLDEAEALNWSKRRGARSGRIAWHFITELAGRAGKQLG